MTTLCCHPARVQRPIWPQACKTGVPPTPAVASPELLPSLRSDEIKPVQHGVLRPVIGGALWQPDEAAQQGAIDDRA